MATQIDPVLVEEHLTRRRAAARAYRLRRAAASAGRSGTPGSVRRSAVRQYWWSARPSDDQPTSRAAA